MTRYLSMALALCLFAAPAFADSVNTKPPEGAKQGAVHFDHQKHGIDQKADKNGESCKKCHEAVKGVKAGDMSATNPAHATCLTCHKGDAGKAKNAPTACTGCHAKKA
jgi:hypothetical protein